MTSDESNEYESHEIPGFIRFIIVACSKASSAVPSALAVALAYQNARHPTPCIQTLVLGSY